MKGFGRSRLRQIYLAIHVLILNGGRSMHKIFAGVLVFIPEFFYRVQLALLLVGWMLWQ